MNDVRLMLDARYPGLYGSIVSTLVEAEANFNARTGQAPSRFLLEHTLRTTVIARKLCGMEGVDPFLPMLVALFHDTGKFHGGEYHKDDIPEEEHAALIAERTLFEHGLGASDIDLVLIALRALYDDRLPCAGICRVVQDADRLDKLGPLGVGAFFAKATLRGRDLVDALVQTLSRELTYANAAPRAMFTESGRKLAEAQAPKTLAFFDDLTDQLESWDIASFTRHTIRLEEGFRSRDGVAVRGGEVIVAMLADCPDCQSPLELTHRVKRGLKCERFIARFDCTQCNYANETSLCLPVIASV
jgi:HD superfamily phosphodiesterase